MLVLIGLFLCWLVVVVIGSPTVTFISIGFGKYGKQITQMAINDRGLSCIGAFTKTSNHGVPISQLIDTPTLSNDIIVSPISFLPSFLQNLSDSPPNIAFVASQTSVNDTFDQTKLLISNKINVLNF